MNLELNKIGNEKWIDYENMNEFGTELKSKTEKEMNLNRIESNMKMEWN